jgi:hypothetical protein
MAPEPVVQFTRDSRGRWGCTVKHQSLQFFTLQPTLFEAAEEMAELLANGVATRQVKAKYAENLAELSAHFAMVLDSIRNPDGLEPDALG